MPRTSGIIAVLVALFTTLLPLTALAEEPKLHVIKMITEDGQKLFVPDFLQVAVGDTVQFVNISGNHNTESIKGMIPEGAERWNSQIEQTFDLTITVPGVYGYKCTPHLANGMVGLIVAGDGDANLKQTKAVKLPLRATNWFELFFDQLDRVRAVEYTARQTGPKTSTAREWFRPPGFRSGP